MSDILKYETYLFISSTKLIISVTTDLKKKIYQKELLIDDQIHLKNFEKIDYFLNQNIFTIEKKFQNFIERVTIILDLNVFFSVKISVKKNNHNDYINLKSLNHLLYEAKESCKKTIDQKKIIHMIINNFQIDDKSYSLLPKDIKCQNYSLDLELICLSENFLRELEIILKKYHISLNRVVSADYIKDFCSTDDRDIFLMAEMIVNGHNPNEVILIDKPEKNEGFFEKFFNFFN